MSKERNDGGPVFNLSVCDGAAIADVGLSVRDWFAGMALQGITSNSSLLAELFEAAIQNGKDKRSIVSVLAYKFADAMLETREAT